MENISKIDTSLHSMKHRSAKHDYSDRGIYMLTFVTINRQPLFGRVVDAKMQLSELGALIEQEVLSIPRFYPQLEILQVQIMPDHLHVLIFIHERLSKHLSFVVKGFKIGCNRIYHAFVTNTRGNKNAATMTADGGDIPRTTDGETESPILFESGYHDRFLRNHGQLENLMNYIKENPRRLWIKQQHRELFEHVTNLSIGSQTYAAIGNRFLLQRPDKLQVQCSRKISEEELYAQQEQLLEAGREGTVLVSPCISLGEKQIARAALEAGVPLIVLLENGFPEYYKPPKTYFEACAAGRLLMLAPWEYHFEKRTITRTQCLALNAMAKDICQHTHAAIETPPR